MSIYLNGKAIEDKASTFLGDGRIVLDVKDGSPVLRDLTKEIPITYFCDSEGNLIVPFTGEFSCEDGVYQISIDRVYQISIDRTCEESIDTWGFYRAKMEDPFGNNWSVIYSVEEKAK